MVSFKIGKGANKLQSKLTLMLIMLTQLADAQGEGHGQDQEKDEDGEAADKPSRLNSLLFAKKQPVQGGGELRGRSSSVKEVARKVMMVLAATSKVPIENKVGRKPRGVEVKILLAVQHGISRL